MHTVNAVNTRNPGERPDIPTFRRLTRSLAVLDAILSPVWEDRYYSFDAHWAQGKLMASMRNGQGDHWFPGENAAKAGSVNWNKHLQHSPFAERIPAILAEAHELLFEKPVARLSQS